MSVEYLVTSAGRSGSIFLSKLIGCCVDWHQVTHTHDLVLPTINKNSVLVICDRRDLLASILSMCIAKRTNEYVEYSGKTIEPFDIDCAGPNSEFAYQFSWHRWYQHSCTTSKTAKLYKNIEVFYFEDFINNHQMVFDRLNIVPVRKIQETQKSPHNIKTLIKNYNQCKDTFDSLMESEVFRPHTAYDPLKENQLDKIYNDKIN